MGVSFFYFSREFEFSKLEKEPKKRLVTRQVLKLDMAVFGPKIYAVNLDEKKGSHAKLSGRGWLKLCGREFSTHTAILPHRVLKSLSMY